MEVGGEMREIKIDLRALSSIDQLQDEVRKYGSKYAAGRGKPVSQ